MPNMYKTLTHSGSGPLDKATLEFALAKSLKTLDDTLIFSNKVTDRSAEARVQNARFASKISVPKFTAFSSSLKTPGTDIAATAVTHGTGVELVINKHRYVDFALEDFGAFFVGDFVAKGYLEQAAKDIAEDIEADIIAEFANAGNTIGTANSGLSDSVVRQVKKQARANRFRSKQETYFVIGDEGEEDLLGVDRFVLNNQSGNTSALTDADLGRKYGMQFYFSSVMPSIVNTPTSEIGMVFQKEAIAIAFIDMDMGDLPTLEGSATKMMTMDYVSEEGTSQYSLRVEMGRDMSAVGTRIRVDTIYGVKTVRPELLIAVRY